MADLIGPMYGYTIKDGRDAIILEKKEDMKKRGLASPDHGDALALTFSYPVSPADRSADLAGLAGRSRHEAEYNPFSHCFAPVNPVMTMRASFTTACSTVALR